MFSKKNNKGFTLMEMLIVVAIIAILIAIMIPTFNGQLEKARETADAANIRSAYAEVMVAFLDPDNDDLPDGVKEGTASDVGEGAFYKEVELQQAKGDWQTTTLETNLESLATVSGEPEKGGICTVKVAADGTVSFAFTNE